ncbi:LOW QUALITY PROTEIN: hypothetical protein YC2023_122193 [Brassica napus]
MESVAIPEHLIKLLPVADLGIFDLVGYVIFAVEGIHTRASYTTETLSKANVERHGLREDGCDALVKLVTIVERKSQEHKMDNVRNSETRKDVPSYERPNIRGKSRMTINKCTLLFPNEQLETEIEASRSLIQSDTEQHHIPHGKESVQEKKILSQENKIQRFNAQVQNLRRQLVQCRNENQVELTELVTELDQLPLSCV